MLDAYAEAKCAHLLRVSDPLVYGLKNAPSSDVIARKHTLKLGRDVSPPLETHAAKVCAISDA
jgi:hypothetical protein